MAEWFYGREGQEYGPIDEATLRARIAAGKVGPRDLIWSEGMAEWTPLIQLPQFGAGGAVPPVKEEVEERSVENASPYAPPAANLGESRLGPALPVTNSLAIASLVCGVLSLVLFSLFGGVFFGVPAVICGALGLRQMSGSENEQRGRGMAIAGVVTGFIGMMILIFMVVVGRFGFGGI